jgi:translation initiation factor IF-2
VPKASASDALTDGDKQKLLSFLQASHGTATADRKKITLVKKSTSEIKQADATGKARTIQVEVRKKRTFIKRDDDGVAAAETATVHEDAHGAAPLIDEAELSRREEEARRQAELIRRQEEELAERRRQREAQEAREREQVEQVERAEKAAAAAAAQERQSQAVTPTGETPVPAPASAAEAASATAASDRAASLEKSREDARVKAAADSKAKADEEALRANDLIERRQKALAEAEAIRAMMNAPKRVLVPHKAEPKPVAKADEAKPGMKGTLHKPAGFTSLKPFLWPIWLTRWPSRLPRSSSN